MNCADSGLSQATNSVFPSIRAAMKTTFRLSRSSLAINSLAFWRRQTARAF
jgi:hypothetical protein